MPIRKLSDFFAGYVFKHHRKLALVLMVSCAVAGVYLYQQGTLTVDAVMRWTDSSSPLAPFVFMLAYAAMTVFLIPTLPMNLAAGFLWGTGVGGIYAIAGASLGAILSFLIARAIAGERLSSVFRNRVWTWLDGQVTANAWKTMAFIRANPAFPTMLVNYFMGLTKIKFRVYLLGTVLFIAPGTILFAALGGSIRSVTLDADKSAIVQNVVGLSLVLTLLALAYFGLPAVWNQWKTRRADAGE